ncbi:hypothetical protein [Prauserella muralis]|uniref:Uncharacterized protein n=1 Tax=Prauserella muralis TaxID=588067 RepID=A0A2V4AKP4_9PSEU|nr:hypothetical protein [Prauserella muralis]PXY20868.1 hypothetical protein BAY60_25530 [Prauserella muralis]TWE29908.1 hypothetical protein FHX69_2601 [Prauserella muralis]
MRLPSIGLVGRRRTGKTTVADYLVQRHGYVSVAFADPLKAAALALNPIVEEVDPDGASFRRYDRLREEGAADRNGVVRLAPLVSAYGWERAKDEFPEVRPLLQRLGDEAGRQIHGEDVWIRRAMEAAARHRLAGRPVVVPDVRYRNEAETLRDAGFVVIRLTREGIARGAEDEHASETAVDELPVHAEIANRGTVAALLGEVSLTLALAAPAV